MSDDEIKYKLYSPSLEDKPFFEWPIKELDLTDKSKTKKRTSRPAIIKPKTNISEKVLLDRINGVNIQAVLDNIQQNYAVDVYQWRKLNRGGEYYKYLGAGYQLTKKLIIQVIQEVFEEYREREKVKKEKELQETKPDTIVLNASELLHSPDP